MRIVKFHVIESEIMMFYLKIVLLYLIVLSSKAYALMPVTLDKDPNALKIAQNLEFLYDETGTFTIDQIRATKSSLEWQKNTHDVLNLGYKLGDVWARFSLEDRRKKTGEILMELAQSQTDKIEVFVFEGSNLISSQVAGDHVKRLEWSRPARLPLFSLPDGKNLDVYIRLSGQASKQLALNLWSKELHAEVLIKREAFQAMYFGALLTMIAYNFLVGLGTGLSVYFSYVGFLFGFGIFQISQTGHGSFLFWTGSAWFSDFVVFLGITITGLCGNVFASELLGLKKTTKTIPYIHYYFCFISLVVCSTYFMLGYSFAVKISVFLSIVPWVGSLIYYGYLAFRKGEDVAKWYGFAWSVFLIGSLANSLKQAGLLPANDFTNNSQQIGSAVEFILLSFALAQRIKTLNRRIEAEKENALQAERRAREADAKALEEERRLSEQRDQLVANTSHELRTPLNGMMGLIQAVMKREANKLSPDSQKSLEGVVLSSKRLAALIGDILDFSRGERKTISLFRGPVSLREHVETVIDLLQITVQGRPLSLSTKIPEDLPTVYADPNRLQQILFNLVGNAVKFTEKGHVIVRAKTEGEKLVIRVEDSGPGISSEAQGRIFEAFAQADGGIARRFGGTGLGLAITKQLVEAHGGQIGVQSVVGFGSTFWFSLPLSQGEAPISPLSAPDLLPERLISLQTQIAAGGVQIAVASSPRPAVQVMEGKVRALNVWVVDDEPMNRQVLEELLHLSGHHTTLFGNGSDLLERMAEENPPDLILLDVMLPGISGFEVLSKLRQRYNEAELPILLLTAKALEKDLVIGFNLGASDYILKPFVASEVEARIQHQARLREAMWQSHSAMEEGARLRLQLAQMEDQLLHAERLASLGAATAGIAHDLGNPLHHIQTTLGWVRGHAETLAASEELATVLRPEVKGIHESLGLAGKAIKTSLDLTQAIRVAVRTDVGSQELFPLADVTEEVFLLLHHKLKYLEVEAFFDRTVAVKGKRSELIQLVMNLVSNAADSLKERGTKRLRVCLARKDDRITLSVEDSGPGVPEKIRSLIFQPFYTTKPSGQGTGLGLAVVQSVLKRHGGELVLDDSPDLGGARFTVELPAA